jgi:hypothetical protein
VQREVLLLLLPTLPSVLARLSMRPAAADVR